MNNLQSQHTMMTRSKTFNLKKLQKELDDLNQQLNNKKREIGSFTSLANPECLKLNILDQPTISKSHTKSMTFMDLMNSIMVEGNNSVEEEDEESEEELEEIDEEFLNLIEEGENEIDGDLNYFTSLGKDCKELYLQMLKEISEHGSRETPLRFQILDSSMDEHSKSLAINKLNELRGMSDSSGEYHKIKQWISGLMDIPFGNYVKLPCTIKDDEKIITDYLFNSIQILDKAVYGHPEAKSQILQILAQWISNPEGSGNIFAIEGPMGNGKTTLVKEGISKAINRPFNFIALGGASDSSFLEGHSYTYEGSTWGKIASMLMKSKCMNPIIYFDELDKVSNTYKGQEIIGILTHLTDPSQNKMFNDKFFSGVDIDLSKALIIFSFNDRSKINPILMDRIHTIVTKGFNTKDKIEISKNYLIPNILSNFNIKQEDITFTEETITHVIQDFTDEKGVRNLKRCLEAIISKINVLRLTTATPKENKGFKLPYSIDNFKFPITVQKNMVSKLVHRKKSDIPFGMYC
jgi:ATP-dependent Lon protease